VRLLRDERRHTDSDHYRQGDLEICSIAVEEAVDPEEKR
jgi:hypothetical protein